jgi:hypothetical protein
MQGAISGLGGFVVLPAKNSANSAIKVCVFLYDACSYDEGCVLVKLGREEPVASMDNSGKIIWAKHNEIQTVNIKSLGEMEEVRRLRLGLLARACLPACLQRPPPHVRQGLLLGSMGMCDRACTQSLRAHAVATCFRSQKCACAAGLACSSICPSAAVSCVSDVFFCGCLPPWLASMAVLVRFSRPASCIPSQ